MRHVVDLIGFLASYPYMRLVCCLSLNLLTIGLSHANSVHIEHLDDPFDYSQCVGRSDGLSQTSSDSFCLNGSIDNATVKSIANHRGRIKLLFVDSASGDFESAIAIGRRLHEDGSILVIYSKCFSVCASYLIPAAQGIAVENGGLIAMNHRIDRSFADFLRTNASSLTGKKDIAAARKRFERANKIEAERRFFDDLLMSDGYVRSLDHEIDRISALHGRSCNNRHFAMMLDRAYMSSFGIKIYQWHGGNTPDTSQPVLNAFPNYAIFRAFGDVLNPKSLDLWCTKSNNASALDRELF